MHPIIKAIISANDLSAGTFSHEPTETRRPYLRYCVAAAIYEVARALAGLHELISGAAYVAWQSRGERRRGILQNKVNAITESWGALCRVAEDARGSQGAALLLGCSGRFLTHQHWRVDQFRIYESLTLRIWTTLCDHIYSTESTVASG
ncbi:hypothetical protein E2C01_022110 [Portunus trituberculatus]|uniref:Uncharacterized protein n=1 Tax=Portunus trituberculatus TaxID=210409 RepID=A0A5B7E6D5_PORTR|nr:hypothetical protein [Portunus trituberculatus]